MAKRKVQINRAPVLTLWAAVVAERLGYDHETALTLGRAIAGLNAQSKGRRLGIFEEPDGGLDEGRLKAREAGGQFMVPVLGRQVPAVRTPHGIRATVEGNPMDPQSVRRYLEQKFGQDLDDVQATLESLAKAYQPDKLATQAYSLYEKFRPSVPEGQKGWGAKGELDLNYIRSLAK
jgi:hypothetical protein